MTIRTFTPADMAAPASNYSQGASVPAGARWLHVSGQIGIDAEGDVKDGFDAQYRQCFTNLLAVLQADGMSFDDIVKLTVFVTPHGPDVVGAYRDIRDEILEGRKPACTYVGVTSLATDALLVEVEAVAAKVDD